MAEEPDNKALLEELQSLRREVAALRADVDRLQGKEPAAPPPASPAKKAPLPRYPSFAKPAPASPSAAAPITPSKTWIEQLQQLVGPDFAPTGLTWEQFVGEKLLHYVGLLILALGIGFFLVWRAAHTGPLERVIMSFGAGGTLIGLGLFLKSRPPYDKLSNGIVGGGWTVVYLTAFAAHHFEATKVIDDRAAAGALLLAVAAGVIAHALTLKSKAFRIYGFALTYVVLYLTRQQLFPFEAFLLLMAASAVIAVQTGFADIVVVNVLGYALNYLPVFGHVLTLQGSAKADFEFTMPFLWLAAGYAIPAVLPLIPRAREKLFTESEARTMDAALCLNAVLFGVMAYSMTAFLYATQMPLRALGLSVFLALPGVLYLILLPKDAAVSSIAPVMGLGLLAAGILYMPSPLWRMFAWIAASSFWMYVGLYCDHSAWRVSGLIMAVLTFGVYFGAVSASEADRQAAGTALLLFGGLSYGYSRTYRLWLKGEIAQWEEPVMEYWLYVGTAAVLLGLWSVLDAAPFAIAVMALAIAGEFAAVRFSRPHLWLQAALVEVGIGVYSFFIDYGANLSVGAGLSPRIMTSACLVAGMAYLYFDDPTPADFPRPKHFWPQKAQRRLLSWVMLGVACFAVYTEVGARMRLPAWALGALFLYYLGGERDEEQLKLQGMALSVVTGVEGVFSYLMYPKQLMAPVSQFEAVMYWGSCFALLAVLFLAQGKRPTALDRQAGGYFTSLSAALMAFYLAKELESYNLTLAWSVEAIAFLSAGIALEAVELRYPGLLLLGLCVAKALLMDTSHLSLPYRVASFLVLGAILIGASMLYVKREPHEKARPPDRPA